MKRQFAEMFVSVHTIFCVLLTITLICGFVGISNGHSENHEEKIVIIGAGASGIAAAGQLLKNGYRNIVILEAEDRIGGRVWTVNDGDKLLEMGSQWYVF